jgi:predicted  nucleic acid-binding Zn-ribbon protein
MNDDSEELKKRFQALKKKNWDLKAELTKANKKIESLS